MATPGPRLSHSHRECLIASRPPTSTPRVPAGPSARNSQDESDRSNPENETILVWQPTLARGPIPIEPVPLARLIVRVVSQQARTGRPLRRHLQRLKDRGKSVRIHRRLRLAVQSGVQAFEHPPGLALKLHGLVDSRIGLTAWGTATNSSRRVPAPPRRRVRRSRKAPAYTALTRGGCAPAQASLNVCRTQ